MVAHMRDGSVRVALRLWPNTRPEPIKQNVKMNLGRVRVSVCVASCISVMSGCSTPNGLVEFSGSRHAVQQLDHLAIEWTSTTKLGVFTEIAELDCGLRS